MFGRSRRLKAALLWFGHGKPALGLALLLLGAAGGAVFLVAWLADRGGGGGSTGIEALRPRPSPAASALPFTATGSGSGRLYPGGPLVPVEIVLSNPNETSITLLSLTTTVTGTSARACSAANFTVARQLTATPTVPAGATVTLAGLGLPRRQWPQLRMLDVGAQDACTGALVHLRFSARAQLVLADGGGGGG